MNQSKFFYAKIYGDRALITSPESKSGGEKMSAMIPTREMLRGIVDANYFKPVLKNVVDEVRVMHKIESYTQGTRLLLKNGKADLSAYTYLQDVCYYIKFHFEWNEARDDLKGDRNFNKHEAITARSLKRGGRRPIFLGTSECAGYIEELTVEQYENDPGYYDDKTLGFGLMFNEFVYPMEPGGMLQAIYAPINMKNGRIDYNALEGQGILRDVRNYDFKVPTQTKTVDEELEDY